MTSTHDTVETNARYYALGRISTLFGIRGPVGADRFTYCSPQEALEAVYDALNGVMIEAGSLEDDDIVTILENITFSLKRQFGGQCEPGFVVPLGSSEAWTSRHLTPQQEEALAAIKKWSGE